MTEFALLLAQVDPPSDTFYTVSSEWGLLVVVYLFLGGIAGGAGFLGGMLHLFGAPQDRPMARIAFVVAFAAIALSAPLLIIDLNRPDRFWHMFLQSENGGLMFKWWSPISYGAWGVNAFSAVATLAAIGAIAHWGVLPRALRGLVEGTIGRIIAALTGLGGLFVAGYTGLLLAYTNRPLWGDTTLLGLLFLLSGVSAAAALLTLIGRRRAHPASVHWLGQLDAWSTVLELATLAILAVSLGGVAREVWGNGWGVLLVVGVVLLGLLVPLALHLRPRLLGRMSVPSAAALVLLGSFLLRTVIVLSSEAV